jgi:hypothetical protein
VQALWVMQVVNSVLCMQAKHGANSKDSVNQSGGRRNKMQSIWYI